MPSYTRRTYSEMFQVPTAPLGLPPALDDRPGQPPALDLISQARSVLTENSQGLPTHVQRIPSGQPDLAEPPVVVSRGPVAPGDTALFRLGVVNEDTVCGVCGVEVSPFLSNAGLTVQATVEPGPTPVSPGASVDFLVRVPVPPSALAGRYHGIATVSGAEAGPVVLVLTVGRTP